MKTLVIYASHYGNTKKVAEAIADALPPPVDLSSVAEASGGFHKDFDLLVVGGPTEGHGMTEPVKLFLDQLSPDAINGKWVAAFDTRLRWPRWLSGSAAGRIEDRLVRLGGVAVAPAESFFVLGNGRLHDLPELDPGELERAADWAATLVEKARQPLAAAK